MQDTIVKSIVLAGCLFFGMNAHALVYSEAIDGDLSNLAAAPTPLVLDLGANTVSGSTSIGASGDFDFFTITVPINLELSTLFLDSFSAGNLSFMGVQSGTSWTEGTGGGINPANLLGWTHFGTGNSTVGTDLLDDLGAGAGAMGFTPPLPSGDYTFLVQDTGSVPVAYGFTFNVVPEPSAPAALIGALIALAFVRSKRAGAR